MFVNTNILVSAAQAAAPLHQTAGAKLSSSRAAYGRLRLSRQVLRVSLAVVTRPQYPAHPLAIATALDRVRSYTQLFLILEDGPEVAAELDRLCRRTPGGAHPIQDANIIATMLAHGTRRLLTNNVRDFVRSSHPQPAGGRCAQLMGPRLMTGTLNEA